ncbi:MAG TPA: transglutaminase domain-containing protein [Burkholderiaceae bacterium]|nr:transglutaminase domain-containing protein [Burkholderiaceae bacterium]
MSREQKAWKRTFWLSALLSVLLVASLAPYLTSSTELVRLRNSLLYQPITADAQWTPAQPPDDYLVERSAPTSMFERIATREKFLVPENDWETALRIGRHLVHKADATGRSGPIQQDLEQTYRRITEAGDGYCGDYVDVFTGLATTVGIFTRSWAFSFDGFGGHGHIFNEIWDRQAGAWRMIDVFNNYYVVDAEERPLSALEFREQLLRGEEIRWRAVDGSARPGFVFPEKALDYYSRGAPEWYLWWGNNVFDYDGNEIVGLASGAGRSVAQLAAIAAGVHPTIRVIHMQENEARRVELVRLRYHLIAASALLALLFAVMLFSLLRMRSARRAGRAVEYAR